MKTHKSSTSFKSLLGTFLALSLLAFTLSACSRSKNEDPTPLRGTVVTEEAGNVPHN